MANMPGFQTCDGPCNLSLHETRFMKCTHCDQEFCPSCLIKHNKEVTHHIQILRLSKKKSSIIL